MPMDAEELEGFADVIVRTMKAALDPLKQRIAALEKEVRQLKMVETVRTELQKAVR
jgi:hypothetical protein